MERSFQPAWFDKWPWLHYNEEHDVVFCHICLKAKEEKKIMWSNNAEEAFMGKGFTNWKDASAKFDKHSGSSCHKEALLKICELPATTKDIGESLSEQHSRDRLERRQCLLKLLSNARFLARQGLPFRGHDENSSNFHQLLLLRGEDDERVATWVQKKTDKYTSPDIQNEMLDVMALKVLRTIVSNIQAAPFFSIMVDETTDIANKEQLVVCLRWVDDSFESHEDFIGLHEIESTSAATIVHAIHDTMIRLNLSFTKVRGQCYDGAACMSGHREGVATQICEEEPRAIYTHCYGHSLNLAVSDTVRQCTVIGKAFDIVYEITKLIKKSPRRQAALEKLKQEVGSESPGVRILCPTRWTVCADTLHRILTNYDFLQTLWEESLESVKEPEMRSRITGVSVCMKSFDFFFGVAIGEMLLRHSDNLSRTLQLSNISAAEGQSVAKLSLQTLTTLRTEGAFALFWSTTIRKTENLDVSDPVLPRKRRAPRDREIGTGDSAFAESVQDHYRRIYYEALDLIVNCITSRFQQTGYKVYCNLENLLLKSVKKCDFTEELEFVCSFYGSDFNKEQLQLQLPILANALSSQVEHNFHSLLAFFRNLSSAQRALMSEVCTLFRIILVMPATNAVSERSFSALRRVKSYLRSTMTQRRLNNIMILHVHKDQTDQLSLIEVGNEFVQWSDHRRHLFGKFLLTD